MTEQTFLGLGIAEMLRGMAQTKEVISASILPINVIPFWEVADPRGGFYERKRLRIKAHHDERVQKMMKMGMM